jgi:A/G-specific adenine glycosylase
MHCANLYSVLQQTRVSTVIPYFKNWISKWPTVQDLANADHDDVLALWKGLGYYSRATRLHEGAKAMIAKSAGLPCPLPSKAADLQLFPGIGKYTAGAVSSIAFGEAEPVVDGNVARVLSRQLGLYMDSKDKKTNDILWEEANRLIEHVSSVSDYKTSAIPGQWNQALMELGSTVCTPRPQCDVCPIQATCRVYSEGRALSIKPQPSTAIDDIEDACTLCESLDTEDLITTAEETGAIETPSVAKKRKVRKKQSNKISHYFSVGTSSANATHDSEEEEDEFQASQLDSSRKRKTLACGVALAADTKSIATYCSLFPKKVAKKKAAEEECVVCVVELRPRTGKSKWLIEQRPAKGLLASLWYVGRNCCRNIETRDTQRSSCARACGDKPISHVSSPFIFNIFGSLANYVTLRQFPQSTLSEPTTTPASRKASAQTYISSLSIGKTNVEIAHVAAFPSLVHVFTHIRLTMHVHQFSVSCDNAEDVSHGPSDSPSRKWVETEDMSQQTLSTGMRKCWDLVAKAK